MADISKITIPSGQYNIKDANAVRLTGDQSISGTKTFTSSPLVPDPTADTAAVNKQYLQQEILKVDSAKINIDNTASKILNVEHIGQDAYYQKVVAGNVLSNTIYILSSDHLEAYGRQIKDVADPTDLSDAVNKKYVDEHSSSGDYLPLSGGTVTGRTNFTGRVNFKSNTSQKIYNYFDPSDGYFSHAGEDAGSVYRDKAYIYLSDGASTTYDTETSAIFEAGSVLKTYDYSQIKSTSANTDLRQELNNISAELSVVDELNEFLEEIIESGEDLATKTYVNQVSSNIVNRIPTKTSDITNDSGFITTAQKGVANGIATLGSDGKVVSSQLPAASNEFDYIILKDQKAGSTDKYKLCIYDGSLSVVQL